jgi:hypothetical protein
MAALAHSIALRWGRWNIGLVGSGGRDQAPAPCPRRDASSAEPLEADANQGPADRRPRYF